jgi:hypothetical protein
MASRSVSADFLAKALNSARNANITDNGDSETLGELISEYFTTPGVPDDSSSDDESDRDGGIGTESDETESEHGEENRMESDIESDEDQPLIEDFGLNGEMYNDIHNPDVEKLKFQIMTASAA